MAGMRSNHGTRATSGFTLIELSMVLVIIALLVGGILVGAALIRAAELRAQAKQLEQYETAINSFRIKYNCLPGDCLNATNFFGTASDCTSTAVSSSPRSGTCNGNGDSRISDFFSSSYVGNTIADRYALTEMFTFWEQLAAAGLISGQYSGKPVNAVAPYVSAKASVNVPPARAGKGGCIAISYMWPTSGYGHEFNGVFYGTVFQVGTPNDGDNDGVVEGACINKLFTTEEMYSYDQKYDDGAPGTGRIISSEKNSIFAPNCTTTDDPLTARYDITQTGPKCFFNFKLKSAAGS